MMDGCVIGPGTSINHETEISVSRTFSDQAFSGMRKKCHVRFATNYGVEYWKDYRKIIIFKFLIFAQL